MLFVEVLEEPDSSSSTTTMQQGQPEAQDGAASGKAVASAIAGSAGSVGAGGQDEGDECGLLPQSPATAPHPLSSIKLAGKGDSAVSWVSNRCVGAKGDSAVSWVSSRCVGAREQGRGAGWCVSAGGEWCG